MNKNKKSKINVVKIKKIIKKRSIFDDYSRLVEDRSSIDSEISQLDVDETTTERKSIESEFSMIVQDFTFVRNKKFQIKVLLNEDAEINVINYRYVVVCDMKLIENDFSTS